MWGLVFGGLDLRGPRVGRVVLGLVLRGLGIGGLGVGRAIS